MVCLPGGRGSGLCLICPIQKLRTTRQIYLTAGLKSAPRMFQGSFYPSFFQNFDQLFFREKSRMPGIFLSVFVKKYLRWNSHYLVLFGVRRPCICPDIIKNNLYAF